MTPTPIQPTLILAQEDPGPKRLVDAETRDISDAFVNQTDSVIPVELLIAAIGLLLIVVALISAFRFWKSRHDNPHPLLVFHRLAKTAQLTLREQWLLYRIARRQALPSPITLLVSPRTLRLHANAYARGLNENAAKRCDQVVAALSQHLFGSRS